MELKRIDGHTIDISLLTKSAVIDLGCRGFSFAKELHGKGSYVLAFDADDEVFVNVPIGISAYNKAVTTYNGTTVFYKMGEAGFTIDVKEYHTNQANIVECVSLESILPSRYDILKMDIEGGEYAILSDPNFKSLPKQISVEFHEHTHTELHRKEFPKVLANLNRWYDLVYIMEENQFKYIDTLFIRRT